MSQEMGRAEEGRRRRVEDKSVDESEDGSKDRLEDHWRVESRKEGERKESEDKAGRMSHGTSRGGDFLSLFLLVQLLRFIFFLLHNIRFPYPLLSVWSVAGMVGCILQERRVSCGGVISLVLGWSHCSFELSQEGCVGVS